MKIRPDPGLTFDDVLLVPRRSAIRSRRDVSTASWLTPDIRLQIPIVSANMDTVTETRMAIAMAQHGGIGIIHRFMTIQQQAEMVERVKRAENMVVEDPISIRASATIAQARQLMAEEEVGGLMVTDENGILLGVVTTRDVLLAETPSDSVQTVMTPRERLIVASKDETLENARRKLHSYRIEKLPLVDEEGHIVGLITTQDIVKIEQHPDATKDSRGRLMVGVAVGARADDLERAAACVAAGADVLVVDIAHGHSDHTLQMVSSLKKRFSVPVIAGNVATAEGVRDLADAGADAVKVGVGAGSICITRLVTGFGVPQLTAILECAEMGHRMKVPIIADGGVRNSGDLVKALAAGASTVMLGSMLAGTDESPGAPVVRGGRRYKVVRGMASLTANIQRKAIEKGEISEEDWGEVVPEGVEAVVPARGAVADILHQLVGGLRSGLSYAGARNIEELWEKAEFIPITRAGMEESGPHDVEKF
ncbi:MAG TPA: IMP dehydrogenase [Anaerolinea thermolimosa]|uniref:Inosine-5'-monophosphate dehydrogenase n=1 Tax=Anaerolinea thermolimosa TaxID=229919 RepID=A0A3D1JKN2_9CHLR|nr:IMP dehydrogenase [Anaerolinea thermolimosa]GAP05437.1 inosine-5'-monophosphate dehydrogenase [Anaerolinea thermolimosa]HCE18206.1 IMP dehydrogenase [Anaerolinea thermolimosa]